MRQTWRGSEAAFEGLRNVAAYRARFSLAVVIIALACGAITTAELHAVDRAFSLEERYREQGRYVFVARDEAGIDASSCATLGLLDFVIAAGGARDAGAVAIATSPATEYRLIEASYGAVRVWTMPPNRDPLVRRGGGVYVGNRVMLETGVTREGMLLLEHLTTPIQVLDVLGPRLRNEAVERAIVAPIAPTGRVSECWIEVSPLASDYADGVIASALGGSSSLSVRQLVDLDEIPRSPSEEVAERLSRYGWIPLGLVGILSLWTITWFRRSELALYRALGMPRSRLLLMGEVDSMLVALWGGVVGVSFAVALTMASGVSVGYDALRLGLRSTGSGLLLIIALGPWPYLTIGRSSVAALLKDR